MGGHEMLSGLSTSAGIHNVTVERCETILRHSRERRGRQYFDFSAYFREQGSDSSALCLRQ